MKSRNVLLNSAMHAKISDVSLAGDTLPLYCTRVDATKLPC